MINSLSFSLCLYTFIEVGIRGELDIGGSILMVFIHATIKFTSSGPIAEYKAVLRWGTGAAVRQEREG